MTPKELLYIEDTLEHHQQMQCAFKDLSAQITDNELKTFVDGLATRQAQSFQNFYTLLNG